MNVLSRLAELIALIGSGNKLNSSRRVGVGSAPLSSIPQRRWGVIMRQY